MSIPGDASPLLLGGGAQQYKIERSLRFNSSDSAYLFRTPASAGNRKTWTWSGWVKRSALTANNYFFGCETATTQSGSLYFSFDAGAFNVLSFGFFWRTTTAVFRDPSAWFHLVVAVDTTESTANNRIRIYFNGVEQTSFSTLNNPTQNADLGINQAAAHVIGDYKLAGNLFYSGYLADIHFIDGQALTPSSFAETNITTGQWVPKAFSGGSYGTNGFRLAFADNSNNTATTLGKDSSPNGNNWTPNNLSVTAGAGNDSLVDTPTSYGTDTGAGGEVRGNYCTLNPLAGGSSALSNGNLQVTSTAGFQHRYGSIGVSSGKWYWEHVFTVSPTASVVGISNDISETGSTFNGIRAYLSTTGNKYAGTSFSLYGATWAINDVMGIALDMDAGTLTFYKNGVSQGTAFTGLTGTWFPLHRDDGNATAFLNFGQRPFAYTAPSGFKALCDTNLPAPVVAKPNSVFDVALWTGTGATRNITGYSFSPDFVWIKGRSQVSNHFLFDAIRGASNRLCSSLTVAEASEPNTLTAFNSDGFSLGTDAGVGACNVSGQTYVGWCWDAGSSTVTNTQGSITSQVRANASAGFSIVSWTGTSALATIGHELGVAPSFIIIKRRSGVSNWDTYHVSIGNGKGLSLNTTDAAATSADYWNNTSPTSGVFTVNAGVNPSGVAMIAYCFAPVAGYSSFGSYTGNGSTDGPFVYTGFRPRWVLIKRTDATADWYLFDTERVKNNATNFPLNPNLSKSETDTTGGYDPPNASIDSLSNGFKLRNLFSPLNGSNATYIYAAFAENPFQYARAR